MTPETPYSFSRPYDAVLCRYSEIATKGRNRSQFENRLIEAIQRALAPDLRPRILRERGRLFLRPPKPQTAFSAADVALIRRALPWVSGLVSASPGFLVAPEPGPIEAMILETFKEAHAWHAARSADKMVTYCLRARRSNKAFPMRSAELEVHFADILLDAYANLKVDLDEPLLRAAVEIRDDRAFVSYEQIRGPGGLPAGTGGRVLAMLSGGIDSPVACYQMMRRGCTVDFVTFHSEPYTPPALITKVAGLARILNRYQGLGRLVAVNLLPAQKAIRDTCQPRFRTLLYRRFMVRISCILAQCLRAKALVTGDNIGQVASQTLDNLAVINHASDLMILRPLLAADKNDTVAQARQIGTLDASEEDVPDSCTVFAPPRPATSARLYRVVEEEDKLDVAALIAACLEPAAIVDLETLEPQPIPKLGRMLPYAVNHLGRTRKERQSSTDNIPQPADD